MNLARAFGVVPPAAAGRRGWSVLALLAPHVALGTWLVVVPDRVMFTAAQVAVLAHVLVAAISAPLFLGWLWAHTRGRLLKRLPQARDKNAAGPVVRHALALVALLAIVTGLHVAWAGKGSSLSTAHAIFGVGVALPLGLHLALERRPLASLAVFGALTMAVAASVAARDHIAGEPAAPLSPTFQFTARPTRLYSRAAWCGECHTAIYAEWQHSTHARSMQLGSVRRDFQFTMNEKGARFLDDDLPSTSGGEDGRGLCVQCHTPSTFYGDDSTPVMEAQGPVADGVGCVFCHTVRGVQEAPPMQTWWTTLLQIDTSPRRGQGFFISAPETVRAYLGQESPAWLARKLANVMIRWRPEMHRRDYHSPVLDTSKLCQGCHRTPYSEWTKSEFNTGNPATTTHCQDCHMVRALDGKPIREPGALVPWGPTRPQRRTHLWAGGNVRAAIELGDSAMAPHERAVSRRGLEVSITGPVNGHLEGSRVTAQVVVRSRLIGHAFPTGEDDPRYAWVQLEALDDAGRVVATQTPPQSRDDERSPCPKLKRLTNGPPGSDTTIGAGQSRTFELSLDVPSRVEVKRLRASVHVAFDEEPVATGEYVVR